MLVIRSVVFNVLFYLNLLVQLIAAGGDSFIFPAFWSFVPGMDTLRIWPRMTVILLFPLALLIGLAYDGIVSARLPDRRIQRLIWHIAIVVAALQILLWTTKTYAPYTQLYFPRLLSPDRKSTRLNSSH